MKSIRISTYPNWNEWRWPLAAGTAVAFVWWLFFRVPFLWVLTGIGEANRPFLDLYALLAAIDGIEQGISPYGLNPLDPYNRGFGFSEWWFAVGCLGWGREDVYWLGTIQTGFTLVAGLIATKPRNAREAALLGGLLVSPAILMGVNRANQDAIIFMIMTAGLICLRQGRGPIPFLGVIFAAIGAVLKYFPLANVVLLLGFSDRRRLLAALGLYGLVLVLAWPGVEVAFHSGFEGAPSPEWLYAFGAPVFWRNLGLRAEWFWLVPALLLVGWVAAMIFDEWRRAPTEGASRASSAETEFVCASAMIVGSFLLGVSYVYKLIFAVWLLPWLWRANAGAEGERWRRWTLVGLYLVTWMEGLMAVLINAVVGHRSVEAGLVMLNLTLACAQIATWIFIACLLRMSVPYVVRRVRVLTFAA